MPVIPETVRSLFAGQPTRMRMGLFSLAPNQWLQPDATAVDQLRQRVDLLTRRRDQVLLYSPEADDACMELNLQVRTNLLEHHPHHAAGSSDCIFIHPSRISLGRPVDGREALEQLARLVPEDFCLLTADSEPRLFAGLVCFPSHWRLSGKAGRTSDEIHRDVPGFAATLARPTRSLLTRLQPGALMGRYNWTIHASDRLHSPERPPLSAALTPENVLQHTWLRLERQTLSRLPDTQVTVFTIRTTLYRMSHVALDPALTADVSATLKSLPQDTLAYRGLTELQPLLLSALDSV